LTIENIQLEGQVCVITGNSEVSNALYGKHLAKYGARIAVLSDTKSSLDVSVQVIKKHGECIGIQSDARDENSVVDAFTHVEQHFGKIDILVNNNQLEFAKPFLDNSVDEWDSLLSNNVRATFLSCREAGKRMVSQKYGRIVNIISGLAERGLANSVAYCASQASIVSLTRALALEWARSNIRVNAIGTGWLSNEEKSVEEQQKELLVRYIPLRRKGNYHDIASLLVFLASEHCGYTTGQPIYVDGGLMAHS